jgi:PadR family transcriptional regulator, regulatory protein PadR
MSEAPPEKGTANGASEDTRSSGHRRSESQAQPRSWLQPFLLLALEQWQSHGYELIRRMATFGFETLDRGSVYRTLRQLEKDGLVVSGWDTSKDGPARRLYTLTDAGRIYLNACAASLRGYQMMLNQFFSLYASPAGPREDEAEADVVHEAEADGVHEAAYGNGTARAAKRPAT